MFYRLIQRKRDEWLGSTGCPVKSIVDYIGRRGMMRDAQVEAIKTYLFLKIKCCNRPLWDLFMEGVFNTGIDFDAIKLTSGTRKFIEDNPAAASLYEYACLKDDKEALMAPALKDLIEERPESIDYQTVFKNFFYGVEYSDYIFSLPMGAGKTFLMAAFIYFDLYFSSIDPDNQAFAHNFMVLAPSGLKSSIVPSVRHIRDFDPTWILPEPAASRIRDEICFEILDEQKTASKSNIVKNPNAQKIANHQPLKYLRGLVAVTNAEKVILDKIDKVGSGGGAFSAADMEAAKNSNELRNIIAQIPNLSIFIDEVHHASDGEIKLRQVVNSWTQTESFNSVLGFSGTPFLGSAEPVVVDDTLSISNKNLSNVVYYYPLVDGVDNFLKSPVIKHSDHNYETIVKNGVAEFIDSYGSLVYADGTLAKQAIYCGRIDNLEENIYPIVCELLNVRGMDPSQCVLKYHGGNKDYSVSDSAASQFASLDTPLSKIRIVLLAQIGKEGWDCKSLASVILPHKNACPQNMVLQTSCSCLRQVVKHDKETALVWLNDDNAKILNRELDKQQHTSIDELNKAGVGHLKTVRRFSRMDKLRVPPVDFYQLKISYNIISDETGADTLSALKDGRLLARGRDALVVRQDLSGKVLEKDIQRIADEQAGKPVTFNSWLHLVAKESLGMLEVSSLRQFIGALRDIFDTITEENGGQRCFSSAYNQREVRASIRRAFCPVRTVQVKEELIPREASLLKIGSLSSPVYVSDDSKYYPPQKDVLEIVDSDSGKFPLKDAVATTIATLKNLEGTEAVIRQLQDDPSSYEDAHKDISPKTYHYLPYRFDSGFEIGYFSESLLSIVRTRALEVYFNGDDTLTDFKISCYKHSGNCWHYIGGYVPDFLMLSRDDGGKIKKALIIETKGEGFSAKFGDRREFMDEFVRLNNRESGYDRFRFLYIGDTLPKSEQDRQTIETIDEFFN